MEEGVIRKYRKNHKIIFIAISFILLVSCSVNNNENIFLIKEEKFVGKKSLNQDSLCTVFFINNYTYQKICSNTNNNILYVGNLSYDLLSLLSIEDGETTGRYIYINNMYYFKYNDINYLIYEFDRSNINRSKIDKGFYYLMLREESPHYYKKVEIHNTYLNQFSVKSIFVIDNYLFLYDIENSQLYFLNNSTFEKYEQKRSLALRKRITKIENRDYKIITNSSYYIQNGGD